MYESILFVHSWLRWIVLVATIALGVRSIVGWLLQHPWNSSTARFVWAYNQILGYQILFGLTLFLGASPFVKVAVADPATILSNPVVRFWITMHAPLMLLAFVTFQLGHYHAKKSHSAARFRIYAITIALETLIILLALPWPWLLYGRSWFRWII